PHPGCARSPLSAVIPGLRQAAHPGMMDCRFRGDDIEYVVWRRDNVTSDQRKRKNAARDWAAFAVRSV
ncbi:MAG: hypothetical protein K2Y19_02405, partial [Afipia birgiae]|nr:hypothetical protein [Afipia birgiae]